MGENHRLGRLQMRITRNNYMGMLLRNVSQSFKEAVELCLNSGFFLFQERSSAWNFFS